MARLQVVQLPGEAYGLVIDQLTDDDAAQLAVSQAALEGVLDAKGVLVFKGTLDVTS